MRFVREVMGADPDDKQIEALRAIGRGERRISIVSGHGVGKTTLLAWAICWHICVKFPQKTVCTAPTAPQLFDALAAETKAWMRKLPPDVLSLFEIKSDRIELRAAPTESFISFRTSSPDTPEALAGIHSEWVLLIGDEASGIHERVFEAAAGSMSGPNATTLLAGNPVRSSGTFYQTHHKLKDSWYTIHIPCVDHPRVTPDFVAEMKEKYGEASNAFRVRVLGLFPKADDDTIIPFELMDAALRRDVQPLLVRPVWGLDCARFGADRSALAKRRGNTLMEPVKWWRGLDTMQLVGRVVDEWRSTQPSERPEAICVDAIGIGAGVADRLRELNLPCLAINVSESPALTERFTNLRAELFWKIRDWFFKRDCNLCGEDALGDELTAIKYKLTLNGKLQIESKAEMKKRGMPSPDLADSFMLTFAAQAGAASGDMGRMSWKQPLRREIKGLV